MTRFRRARDFTKWLLGVLSVLLGIAGFYWLAIIFGWSLGISESARQITRFSSYLMMLGLPAALLAAVFNRARIGAYILGATFLLFIAPVIYFWTSDYIVNKDKRIQNAMKARTGIEQSADTQASCNGNSIYFKASRWGTSVVLLKPVDEELKPVYLAILNIHDSDNSCEIRKYPRRISTARKLLEQCSEAAQDLQAMLERFEKLQCPHDQ
jgi:hypothetical protein